MSWLVHTRLGRGPKSWLGHQLDLGVLLSATYGELLVVSIWVAWLAIRFAFYVQRFSEEDTTAVRVGRSFGRLGAPMIFVTYLLAARFFHVLPEALLCRILALLPVDERARAAAVHPSWRHALDERSLWTRLDLSSSVSVSCVKPSIASVRRRRRINAALLRGAAARAHGHGRWSVGHARSARSWNSLAAALGLRTWCRGQSRTRQSHRCTAAGTSVRAGTAFSGTSVRSGTSVPAVVGQRTSPLAPLRLRPP